MTDSHAAAQRLRAYLRRLPNAVNIGGEIVWSDEFATDKRPYRGYALDRADLEAVLDALDNQRAHQITDHTYEGNPGGHCVAERFGQICGGAWASHTLRECAHDGPDVACC